MELGIATSSSQTCEIDSVINYPYCNGTLAICRSVLLLYLLFLFFY